MKDVDQCVGGLDGNCQPVLVVCVARIVFDDAVHGCGNVEGEHDFHHIGRALHLGVRAKSRRAGIISKKCHVTREEGSAEIRFGRNIDRTQIPVEGDRDGKGLLRGRKPIFRQVFEVQLDVTARDRLQGRLESVVGHYRLPTELPGHLDRRCHRGGVGGGLQHIALID